MSRKGDFFFFFTLDQNTEFAILPSGLSLDALWGKEQDGAALPVPCYPSGTTCAGTTHHSAGLVASVRILASVHFQQTPGECFG